jgi:ABC-type multidrug transport system ATPase subunit
MDQPSLDRRYSETRSDGTRLDPSEVCPRGNTLSWSRLVVEKGKKVIIDNLQGEAKPAQLSAVMGHSGSGKTTLLRALAGRGAHTGEVFCDGEPINPSSFKFQNRIAFVADSEELEETATCFEAIQFSARLRLPSSFPDSQIDLVTTTLIEELRLGKCKDTQCRFLSAGEKRRVSLAVELVVRPAIVILDEPTSGLDR